MSLGVAVLGCGRWGPNMIRNLSQMPGVWVPCACDPDPAARAQVEAAYHQVRTVATVEAVLADPSVDAVVVATPASTHVDLALRCLRAGRHVLVEKPVGVSVAEVRGLAAAAREADRLLMGGHVFLYHPVVRAAHEILRQGTLGRLRHIRCVRVNQGPVRPDVSVVWDLMPHDLSMLWLWLEGAEPESVTAMAAYPLGTPRADTVMATLRYPDDLLATLTASWVEPAKVRTTMLVGEKGALEFDDLNVHRPLRLVRAQRGKARFYGNSVEFHRLLQEGPEELLPVRYGEPLREECLEFVRRLAAGVTGPGEELEPLARCLSRIEETVRTGVPA